MSLKALCIIAAISLFSVSSCHNKPEARISRSSWIFSYPTAASETTIGKQMPPPHEPDAVLINVGVGSGQKGIPGGNFPGHTAPAGPGIFGIPGGPAVFGIPGGPGVFGVPVGVQPNPGMFGSPNGFGFPGNSRDPNAFFPQGQNNPLLPNGPSVFSPRGQQGNPQMPNGSGVQFGQNGPEFFIGTGVFGVPNESPRSLEPSGFGLPEVFTIAGNNPMPGVPGFFVPGRSSNFPDTPDYLPEKGGFVPQAFLPGGMNRFPPGGMLPGAFFPEAPFVPIQPEVAGGFGGNFPGKDVNGGREIYDEPEASLFPMTVKRTDIFSKIPN